MTTARLLPLIAFSLLMLPFFGCSGESTTAGKDGKPMQVRAEIFEPINRLLAQYSPGMNSDQGIKITSKLETEIKLAKAKANSDTENEAIEVVIALEQIIEGLNLLKMSRETIDGVYNNFDNKQTASMSFEQFVQSVDRGSVLPREAQQGFYQKHLAADAQRIQVIGAYNRGFGILPSLDANPSDAAIKKMWTLINNLDVKSMPLKGTEFRATDAMVGMNDLGIKYKALSEAFTKAICSSDS